MIRTVIIDDSAFMRKSLSIMLESDPSIKIIGTAKNGLEGYELVKKERPDIVTMDIEMPVMDGLTSLKKIMKDCPTSIIMVSSITTEGADSTIKALEYGAVDFIPKEFSHADTGISDVKSDLIKKVKEIFNNRLLRSRAAQFSKSTSVQSSLPSRSYMAASIPKIGYKAIGLGISTGGPLSLQKVIPGLSKDIRIPIFIVQHMPPKFTKSLADRLNDMSEISVKEAENNDEVNGGVVYIAPGGYQMTLGKHDGSVKIIISDKPSNTLHRPSVDTMLNSLLDVYGKYTLGIIMTGMGKDGSEGVKKLKNLGGYCIAQDEESCVVYGMPRSVVERGFADSIVSLNKMSEIINKVT